MIPEKEAIKGFKHGRLSAWDAERPRFQSKELVLRHVKDLCLQPWTAASIWIVSIGPDRQMVCFSTRHLQVFMYLQKVNQKGNRVWQDKQRENLRSKLLKTMTDDKKCRKIYQKSAGQTVGPLHSKGLKGLLKEDVEMAEAHKVFFASVLSVENMRGIPTSELFRKGVWRI